MESRRPWWCDVGCIRRLARLVLWVVCGDDGFSHLRFVIACGCGLVVRLLFLVRFLPKEYAWFDASTIVLIWTASSIETHTLDESGSTPTPTTRCPRSHEKMSVLRMPSSLAERDSPTYTLIRRNLLLKPPPSLKSFAPPPRHSTICVRYDGTEPHHGGAWTVLLSSSPPLDEPSCFMAFSLLDPNNKTRPWFHP